LFYYMTDSFIKEIPMRLRQTAVTGMSSELIFYFVKNNSWPIQPY